MCCKKYGSRESSSNGTAKEFVTWYSPPCLNITKMNISQYFCIHFVVEANIFLSFDNLHFAQEGANDALVGALRTSAEMIDYTQQPVPLQNHKNLNLSSKTIDCYYFAGKIRLTQ